MESIDSELLAILACPKCKAPVREHGATVTCTNPACALEYPVRNGIPVMLIKETVASGSNSETFNSQDNFS